MLVKIDDKGLFLEPETDFETQVIGSYQGCHAFVKCGLTPSEVLGLAIRPSKKAVSGQVFTQTDSDRSALIMALARAKVLLQAWATCPVENFVTKKETLEFLADLKGAGDAN